MKYVPKIYKKTIFDIPYEKLKKDNIKCLIFDLDNTIAFIDQAKPTEEVIELFNKLNKDFDVFILSNNSRGVRVSGYAKELGCKSIRFACKPFTRGLKKIQKQGNYNKENMAIIGDQFMTDIKAGDRFKITTILVDPLAVKDLWVTKFNRALENKKLKKYKKENLFERGKYYE